MPNDLDNWRAQIRKGYLDLCILLLIKRDQRLYGFELLAVLKALSLPVKEGTLYPLLNRMTADGLLAAQWQTENASGHPRKFYSLTRVGQTTVDDMQTEFAKLTEIFAQLREEGGT